MKDNSLWKTKKTWRKRTPLTLRFAPTAWAKLLFLRDAGATEVGGFGISQADDLLLVTEVSLIEQYCSIASVEFDDTAVAEFFDNQVDRGLHPEQFGRLWIHTHPGESAQPSWTDEETFERVFGQTDWAVMFILACGGQTYCRLQYNRAPAAAFELDVEVDYQASFDASDQEAWQAEYQDSVHELFDLKDAKKDGLKDVSRLEEPLFLQEAATLAVGGGEEDYLYRNWEEANWHDYYF